MRPDGRDEDGPAWRVATEALFTPPASRMAEYRLPSGRLGAAWWPSGDRSPAPDGPHAGQQVMRLDLDCAGAGVTRPPCRIRLWLRDRRTNPDVTAQVPAGRAERATTWLRSHGMADVVPEHGVAPRMLHARFPRGPGRFQEMVDEPVRFVEAAPQGAVTLFAQGAPGSLDAWLERIRALAPDVRNRTTSHDVRKAMTGKQKELLSLAVSLGYYDVPRTTNLHGLADSMDMSVGATSELLRRGERAVIHHFVDLQAMRPAGQDAPWMP